MASSWGGLQHDAEVGLLAVGEDGVARGVAASDYDDG